MSELLKIDSVQAYNDYFGVETCNPLVSVIDGHEAKPLRFGRKLYSIYTIFKFRKLIDNLLLGI